MLTLWPVRIDFPPALCCTTTELPLSILAGSPDHAQQITNLLVKKDMPRSCRYIGQSRSDFLKPCMQTVALCIAFEILLWARSRGGSAVSATWMRQRRVKQLGVQRLICLSRFKELAWRPPPHSPLPRLSLTYRRWVDWVTNSLHLAMDFLFKPLADALGASVDQIKVRGTWTRPFTSNDNRWHEMVYSW